MHRSDFINRLHFHRHGEQHPASQRDDPFPRLEQSKGTTMSSVNPFIALSNDAPVIPTRPEHPVPRTFISRFRHKQHYAAAGSLYTTTYKQILRQFLPREPVLCGLVSSLQSLVESRR